MSPPEAVDVPGAVRVHPRTLRATARGPPGTGPALARPAYLPKRGAGLMNAEVPPLSVRA